MKLKEIMESFPTREAFIAAVEEKLREVAAEQPRFVYNSGTVNDTSCYYDRSVCGTYVGTQHGCIFGRALGRLGWNDSQEIITNDPINSLFSNLAGFYDVPTSWGCIQRRQDSGASFSTVIKYLVGFWED